MAEAFGLQGRGAFYDQTGTIRDMIQNHLLQVLSNLAMEPPVRTDSESIRDEKVKVLKAIPSLTPDNVVRGQFRGYRSEKGVAPESTVETFVALRLQIDSWRWQGVPFYIRAGKHLPVTCTEVVVRLRQPPTTYHGFDFQSNYCRFRISPDITIAMGANVIAPGEETVSQTTEMGATQLPGAGEARAAVAARGRFIMAVSGGHTPWAMLRALADHKLPWADVHIVQVDERVAPPGHPDRNLTHLRESLLAHCPLPPEQVHAMPVESADLETASSQYALTLRDIAGAPAVLDLVHLGLGPDGHTASLVRGDPVLDLTVADVALTGVYQGRRRMTLTYPVLNRSRRIVWLVTGRDKADMLARLFKGDDSIPAGRVRRDRALVLADREAARSDFEPSRH